MRKVKVWGGMHPDEKAALAFVDSLQADPIPNVTPGIANPLARSLDRRFVDTNLFFAFPGDSTAAEYEKRRAVEMLHESEGYDVVVDLHNINYYGENTAFTAIRLMPSYWRPLPAAWAVTSENYAAPLTSWQIAQIRPYLTPRGLIGFSTWGVSMWNRSRRTV